jgi:hypothetical protein
MTNRLSNDRAAGQGKLHVAAIALLLSATLLPACTDQNADGSTAASNVTTEEVADQTNELIGQTVTVRAEPGEKIAPATFTIKDDDFFGGEEVLIVNSTGKPFVLPEGDNLEVQVTGKVAKFVLADVERDYGLDLDPNLYVEYENKSAIIAQSVILAPEPGEITENPSQYYGQRLAVTGEVEDVVSPTAFTLDEDELFGASDLLVLTQKTQKAAKDGETVAVTGVLRPFVVADIERDFDIDLDPKLQVEYENKPVFIADAIYPSAIPDGAK